MKIAHVIPLMATVPPAKYGGIEQVVFDLATTQAAHGNTVTIFAAQGSVIDVPGISIIPCAPFPTFEDISVNRQWEIHEFLTIIAHQGDFDVIHFHYEPFISRITVETFEYNLMQYIHVPFLVTFHNLTQVEGHRIYYQTHKELDKFHYVFLSERHRQPLSFLSNTSVIYNGIATEKFLFNEKPGDYLLFIGRIARVKGIVDAISVAERTGKKLKIGARIDLVDQDFFDKEIKPHIDGKQIEYVGEVGFQEKIELYKNAWCALVPIQWEEPFGLVMAESLACGTPIIAYNRGSVPEIIKDGVTGFVVEDLDKMVESVGKIGDISRIACHEEAKKRFSTHEMYKNYDDLYKKIAKA